MNIHIRVVGEHVGMPVDQWCEVIADDGKNPVVARSLGDHTKIWGIQADWINGVKLSDNTQLSFKITNVLRQTRG